MRVPRKVFTIAKCCDSHPGPRYALNGVKLTQGPVNGQPTAVATDGRILAAVTWETAGGTNIPADGLIIDAADCRAIAKLGKPTARQMEQTPDHADVSILADNCQVVALGCGPKAGQERHDAAPVEGQFPKWREIVPTYKAPVSIDLDPARLIQLLQALAPMAESGCLADSIRLTIETEPHIDGAHVQQPAMIPMTLSTGHLPDQCRAIGVIHTVWADNHPGQQAGTAQPKAWD